MSSHLTQLLCCGARPRAAPPDVQSTVIPNEHSRLLDKPKSPAIVDVVAHQSLSDRLANIVRAKEGKMVSVSARTPFTLHGAEQAPSTSTVNGGRNRANVSRRPPVLTMTPARSHGSLNLYSDSRSRHSSDSGSRSSSRQPALRSQSARLGSSAPPTTSVPSSASASDNRGKAPDASEWFAESGSELSVEGDEEPAPPTSGVEVHVRTPIAHPAASAEMRGIAFDWDA
ncbi:hypothetical protein DFH08DRAFT_848553 [Mycena albidolilacea]|uniref:Uncharacterized protein n=1 Tax=Mycena albidolilacea TaxID=1033008 RepID=A0AAD7AHN3_9AGAR|nr:hypothetical protein DFH08DRAFT_848553 [Mycena albidolilacea]